MNGAPARAGRPLRALASAAVFFLKVFPMLPSRPVDWVTRAPVVERVRYPSTTGWVDGELYRPGGPGPHPGVLVCLGVVPFGVDHPQVPVLGRALARAGYAALLYWSPAMRDFRLDPVDVEDIPLAYDWLVRRPDIDPARSGLLGTCVGGAFALMAAAHALVRDRVAFVAAYAPFAAMDTLLYDTASATRPTDGGRAPWAVDQLTRKVFVQSLLALLPEGDAPACRAALEGGGPAPALADLSPEGQALWRLLTATDEPGAAAALAAFPPALRRRLAALSPVEYLPGLRAPLLVLLHDRGDLVIPVSQSRALVAALAGRPGVRYTEMQFSHLDPVKGRLPLPRLLRELTKFFRAVVPIFSQAAR